MDGIGSYTISGRVYFRSGFVRREPDRLAVPGARLDFFLPRQDECQSAFLRLGLGMVLFDGFFRRNRRLRCRESLKQVFNNPRIIIFLII